MVIALTALVVLIVVVQWRAGANERAAEIAYPPIGEIVKVDGRAVHVWIQGTGPDLVLIHGASGNMRDFTFDFAGKLTDRYRVIVFDRPGLGWSDRTQEAYQSAFTTTAESPAEQAEILQKAADQLGVKNPLVLGQSYGGAVALAWGLLRPDDTAGLIVVSGVSNPWPDPLGLMYDVTSPSVGGAILVPLLTAFVPAAKVQTTLDSIFAPAKPPEGYNAYIGAGLTLRRTSFRANARQVTTLYPHIDAMSKTYARLTMPVEIVHGTADTIVPYHIHAEPLSKQLPDMRLTPLDGVGHMPHHTHQEAVIEAIDSAAARAQLR